MPSFIHSSTPVPEELAALMGRIPLFDTSDMIEVEPLQDVINLNNANYCVTVKDRKYILRVAAQTAHYLGIRRDEELEAAQAAANIGIGPEILYAEPEGHLLMAHIEGRHWQPEEYHKAENITRLADTLRRLHQVREVTGDGSVYRRIERLLESAEALQLEPPPALAACRSRMADIEAMRHADPRFVPGLSHNDFWANNFLDDGQQLWLLDWEFSGNGDGFYDLATATFAGSYSEEEQLSLLHAYGYDRPEDRKTLEAMKFLVSFFEGSWGLVMHGLRGSEGFDYLKGANSMFARMAAMLS